MQNPTFLFQFITGILAGFTLHFTLYGIVKLLGIGDTIFYLHNFFVIALLVKWFLFAPYRVFAATMVVICAIIRIYFFYDNPFWSYKFSLAYSIVIIVLVGLVTITSPNWKKVLLTYGLTWITLIVFIVTTFALETYKADEPIPVINSSTINYTTKSHNFNPFPFFLPMYYYDTSSVKMANKSFTKADLKGKVTIIAFGNKVNFGFAYSMLWGILRQYNQQYRKSLQVLLLDVGYYHTIEETFKSKIAPCRANQRGSYIACEDSIFLFAHDENAAFVKAMKFRPIPLIAVFDKDGRFIYEITEAANEESATIAKNLLKEVIEIELKK